MTLEAINKSISAALDKPDQTVLWFFMNHAEVRKGFNKVASRVYDCIGDVMIKQPNLELCFTNGSRIIFHSETDRIRGLELNAAFIYEIHSPETIAEINSRIKPGYPPVEEKK